MVVFARCAEAAGGAAIVVYTPLHEERGEERGAAPALPLRIVFHDYAFANDTAKENVRQLLKQLSGETEMRVI